MNYSITYFNNSIIYTTTGAKEMLKFDSVMSPNLDAVIDAMVTSLSVKVPRSRYVIGLDANVFLWMVCLPTSFVDWLLSLVIKPLKPAFKT
jgi:hypothetical protein